MRWNQASLLVSPMFTFKSFSVRQDRCAMKVGTDGVLLGAWAHVEHCKHVLDMGTGTGLVALMVAQRSKAHIVAIDLDADAVGQAAENFSASPWADRLQALEADIRVVGGEVNSDTVLHNSPSSAFNTRYFDAILCNPPYFENSLKSPDAARSMARHTDTLNFDELARSASRLLAPAGEFSVVIPYDRATDMTISAACYGLFATRQTIVIPVEGGKPKRVLMAFRHQGAPHIPEILYIRDKQRDYTPEYVRLVKEFYLKM